MCTLEARSCFSQLTTFHGFQWFCREVVSGGFFIKSCNMLLLLALLAQTLFLLLTTSLSTPTPKRDKSRSVTKFRNKLSLAQVEPQCAKIAHKFLINCIIGAYNLTMKNGALRFHLCVCWRTDTAGRHCSWREVADTIWNGEPRRTKKALRSKLCQRPQRAAKARSASAYQKSSPFQMVSAT